MPALTVEQIKARAALIEEFRLAIEAAVWTAIEGMPPHLLAADDGTLYADLVTASLGMSTLEQMVKETARAACKRLGDWL